MYKALTVKEIIESLVDPTNNVDTKLLNIFLYTYRTYCSSLEIIQLIDERFRTLQEEEMLGHTNDEKDGFTKAVIMLINTWLTLPFAYDFYEMPDFKCLNVLLNSIRRWPNEFFYIRSSYKLVDSFRRLEEKLKDLLRKFSALDFPENTGYRELPVDCNFEVSYSRSSISSQKSFFEFTTKEIASSLTYLDQNTFTKLRLPELLMHVTKRQSAPTVTAVIDNYNRLYKVVSMIVQQPHLARQRFDRFHRDIQYLTVIHNNTINNNNHSNHSNHNNLNNYSHRSLSASNSPVMNCNLSPTHDDMADRLDIIEIWISVAQELRRMKNYSSVVAIITALGSSVIKPYMNYFKKKKSSTKCYMQFMELSEMVGESVNFDVNNEQLNNSDHVPRFVKDFHGNKEKIKNIKKIYPEVPYLGIYLRHLSCIEDAFPDWVEANEIPKIYDGCTDKLVNLDKCRKQFDVLAQVRLSITTLSACMGKNKLLQLNEDAENEAEDHSFLDWYSNMTLECNNLGNQETKSNGRATSIESLKSTNSVNSSDSGVDHGTRYLIHRGVIGYSKSHECLCTNKCPTRVNCQQPPSRYGSINRISRRNAEATGGRVKHQSVARIPHSASDHQSPSIVIIPPRNSTSYGDNLSLDDSVSPVSVTPPSIVAKVRLKLKQRSNTESNTTCVREMMSEHEMLRRFRFQSNAPMRTYNSTRNNHSTGNSNFLTRINRTETKPYHCETVSGANSSAFSRPPLPNIMRSSTFVNKSANIGGTEAEKQASNLTTVNYKKVKIFENDHTGKFAATVLQKYGKDYMDTSNFVVVQILENENEIQIPANTNIYYALKASSEYVIEVRQKDL